MISLIGLVGLVSLIRFDPFSKLAQETPGLVWGLLLGFFEIGVEVLCGVRAEAFTDEVFEIAWGIEMPKISP